MPVSRSTVQVAERSAGGSASPVGDARASEKPARIVERAYKLRLTRNDPKATAASIASFLELVDPGVVFIVTGGMRFSGRGELASLLHEASQDWHDCRFDLAGLYPAADGRILALGCILAASYSDRPAARIPFANVWTVCEGLVRQVEAFEDRATAENATGIKARFRAETA